MEHRTCYEFQSVSMPSLYSVYNLLYSYFFLSMELTNWTDLIDDFQSFCSANQLTDSFKYIQIHPVCYLS